MPGARIGLVALRRGHAPAGVRRVRRGPRGPRSSGGCRLPPARPIRAGPRPASRRRRRRRSPGRGGSRRGADQVQPGAADEHPQLGAAVAGGGAQDRIQDGGVALAGEQAVQQFAAQRAGDGRPGGGTAAPPRSNAANSASTASRSTGRADVATPARPTHAAMTTNPSGAPAHPAERPPQPAAPTATRGREGACAHEGNMGPAVAPPPGRSASRPTVPTASSNRVADAVRAVGGRVGHGSRPQHPRLAPPAGIRTWVPRSTPSRAETGRGATPSPSLRTRAR